MYQLSRTCCSVPFCNTTRLSGVILHCFPNPKKYPEKFRAWVYAVGGDLLRYSDDEIYRSKKICHNHFEPKYYTRCKILAANAFPTLNLSDKNVKPAILNVIQPTDDDKHSEESSEDEPLELLKPKATYGNPKLKAKESAKNANGFKTKEDSYEISNGFRAQECSNEIANGLKAQECSNEIANGLKAQEHCSNENENELKEEYLSDFDSEPECQPETESQEHTSDVPEQLLMCRGCLATDVKLFDLESMEMKSTFEELVGKTEVEQAAHWLCSYCAVLLVKFKQFRDRCRQTEIILQQLTNSNMLNQSFIKSINRAYYKLTLNFSMTKTLQLQNNDVEIKSVLEEKDLESEQVYSGKIADVVSNDNSLYTDVDTTISNKSIELQKNDETVMDVVDTVECLQENEEEITNVEQSVEYLHECEAELSNIEQPVQYLHKKEAEISSVEQSVEYLQENEHEVGNFEVVYLQEDKEEMSKIEQPVTSFQDVIPEILNIGQYVDCIEGIYTVTSQEKISEDDINFIRSLLDSAKKAKSPKENKKMALEAYYDKKFLMEAIALSEEEQFRIVQARKSSKNYLNSHFRCDYCFKGFMSVEKFKIHYNAYHHPNIGDYQCSICRARMKTKTELNRHKRYHKYLFKCNKCDFKTSNKHSARNHHYQHEGIIYTCQFCGKHYKSNAAFLAHLRMFHPEQNVWCRLCGESCLNNAGLRTHRRIMHTGITEHSCALCGLVFLNESALSVHNSEQCVENCCAQCGHSYPDEDSLKFHFTDKHGNVKCALCTVEFKCRSALKKHIENSNGNCRSVSCCVWCGEGYSTLDLLNDHIGSQHSRFKVTCSVCNKNFPTKKSYNEHYKMSHGQAKWRGRRKFMTYPRRWGIEVGEGGARISSPSLLPQPEEKEPKKFVCEFCGKSFANTMSLKLHLHRHTGEKPYTCSECDKKFATPVALKIHLRRHRGERPYKCKYCFKPFVTQSAVNRHTLIHTGERRHICQICNKKFMTSTEVKTHIKTVHLKVIVPRVRRRRSELVEDVQL